MILLPDTKRNLILWIILSALIPIVILPLHFFTPMNLSDIFLILGASYLAVAGLVFVYRAGTFDLFVYQFNGWIQSLKAHPEPRDRTANEYHLRKKEYRYHHSFPYLPFLVLGGALMITCLVLALVQTYTH